MLSNANNFPFFIFFLFLMLCNANNFPFEGCKTAKDCAKNCNVEGLDGQSCECEEGRCINVDIATAPEPHPDDA